GAHVGREDVPQFSGVLLREVDLVLNAVERELDGLVGVATVEVIDQLVNDLLGHAPLSSRTQVLPHRNAQTITPGRHHPSMAGSKPYSGRTNGKRIVSPMPRPVS